jgi:hypothetical protein
MPISKLVQSNVVTVMGNGITERHRGAAISNFEVIVDVYSKVRAE